MFDRRYKVGSNITTVQSLFCLHILIGSRFFVTRSPSMGQKASLHAKNMGLTAKNSDKSLRAADLIDRLVIWK
jgi:hypothetical protein